jgi:hypothetical protein
VVPLVFGVHRRSTASPEEQYKIDSIRVENGAKLGGPTHPPPEDERKLIDYATNRAAMRTGFSRESFRKYAASLAKKRNKRFKGKGGDPSLKWWQLIDNVIRV